MTSLSELQTMLLYVSVLSLSALIVWLAMMRLTGSRRMVMYLVSVLLPTIQKLSDNQRTYTLAKADQNVRLKSIFLTKNITADMKRIYIINKIEKL